MITVYREDGKPFDEEISIIILEVKESFDATTAVCGGCSAEGFLVFYCDYARCLDVLEGGVATRKEINLDRYQCGICDKTHVIAPGELVIPYVRHSLGFICAVMQAYARREKPVRQIAEDFHIVVSTLYAWRKRFRGHYELLCGKLEAAADDIGEHVDAVITGEGIAHRLFVFVATHKFCFLQDIERSKTSRYFTLRGYLALCRGGSP